VRVAQASEWPHRPGGRAIREANGVELQGVGDLVYRCVIAASRAAFRGLGLRIELRGEEHLPTAGGVVLASNHLSFLDFMFLGLVGVERGRLVRFLCKESVFGPPVVAWAMHRMGHISVDRAHGAVALRHAVDAARSGEVVGVFPEATISRSWTLRAFRPGAAAVAVWEQVPLVPVAMWGGHRIWSAGRRLSLRRGTAVTILVGEPLRPGPGADPVAVTQALKARIDDLLVQAKDVDPDRPRTHADAPIWSTGRARRKASSAG
jgi:1-acyl-sn-glycerol-3-phosphate acyltransferase